MFMSASTRHQSMFYLAIIFPIYVCKIHIWIHRAGAAGCMWCMYVYNERLLQSKFKCEFDRIIIFQLA